MKKIALIIITMVAILSLQSCSDVALVGSTDYIYSEYYVYSRPYRYYHRPVPPSPRRVAPAPKPRPNVGPRPGMPQNRGQGRLQGNPRGSFGGRR